MRHLAADDRADLRGHRLLLQALEVVGGAHEVLGRIEAERRRAVQILGVKPVAREDGQLAVVGKGLQALGQRAEIGSRRAVLVAHVVGVGGIGGKRVQRVDVVEAREVVEPQDRGVQDLGALGEVTHQAGAVGNLNAVGVLGSKARGVHVRDGAHAADALRDERGVVGSAALERMLQAAVQVARGPRLGDLTVLDLHLDGEVTLDAGNGVNGGTSHHSSPPFSAVSVGAASTGASTGFADGFSSPWARWAFLAARIFLKRSMFLGSSPFASSSS